MQVPLYTTLCDDINRRFYPSQFDRQEQIKSDVISRTWLNDHYHNRQMANEERYSNYRKPVQMNQPAPMLPVGFFSPIVKRIRRRALLEYAKILFILWVFVLGVLSLYWGVLINVGANLEALEIAVVSFDGRLPPYEGTEPLVGNALIQITEQALMVPNHLGFKTMSPSEFNDDPLEVRRWCNDLKIWGAIIVNNNATAMLRHAVETGDQNYDPLGAAQIIYGQARDLETINQYVAPALIDIGKKVLETFGPPWSLSVLKNASLAPSIYSKSPQSLNPGIGFTVFNLRPFDHPAAIPSVTIGLIYLIITAFFSFGFFLPIHMTLNEPPSPSSNTKSPPIKFFHLIVWRWSSTVFAYLLLSLSYSTVSILFHIPFTNAAGDGSTAVLSFPSIFGPHTFAAYWIINFFGMCAVGLACENVGLVVGTPWVGLWLIFWVISNVSTGFYALELAPSFYTWGYVWPLHSIVEATRTVLFDTKHSLGKDFGVLVVWVVLNTFCFPFACKIHRWKIEKLKEYAEETQSVVAR